MLLNLNQSWSDELEIFARIFVFAEIDLAWFVELLFSYESLHVGDVDNVVTFKAEEKFPVPAGQVAFTW